MACVAVVESSGDWIELSQEQTRKRRHRGHSEEVAVYTLYDCLRLRVHCRVCTNQPHEMSDPHPCSQAFATDISESKNDTVVNLVSGYKVTRNVTDGKNFACNLKISVPD